MSPFQKTVLAVSSLLAFAGIAHAQTVDNFPNKPIEVIFPYAPGSGAANLARAFAAEASKEMGQPWVVTNREGGGGVVGFAALSRAKPDGYTIGFSPASPMTSSRFVNANVPFKNEQIEPVCQIFENVFAIVVKRDSPIQNLQDLVARAKAAPGSLSYGHAGPASAAHLGVASLEQAAKVQLNSIAYRGDTPAFTDLMGGNLSFAAIGVSTVIGKDLRVLAVLSNKRHPALPDVPSVSEFGFPSSTQGLIGLFLPAGTSRPIFNRYRDVCRKVSASPSFAAHAREMSQVMSYLDAAEFKAVIEKTIKSYEQIVPALHLQKN